MTEEQAAATDDIFDRVAKGLPVTGEMVAMACSSNHASILLESFLVKSGYQRNVVKLKVIWTKPEGKR